MLSQFKNPKFYIILAADLLLICFSLAASYLIRFDFNLRPGDLDQILALMPFMAGVKITCLFFFGMYQGMFRYAGLADLWRLFKALGTATLIIVTFIVFVHQFQGYSRAVFIIDFGMTLMLLGGFRLLIRIVYQYMQGKNSLGTSLLSWKYRPDPSTALIIGAGNTGEKILREILGNPGLKLKIAGFLDDDQGKIGRSIHGVPVLGQVERLSQVSRVFSVKQAIIATPSAKGSQIRKIMDVCKQSGVEFKTMPGIAELIDGQVSVKELRDVNFHDLLRRNPVRLDIPEIEQYLKNRRVLVTGAGGSIGSELCRQIARFEPERLIMFDSSEPSLYNIEMEMKHRMDRIQYSTILGRCQDEQLVQQVFSCYRPAVIFHAAAYKHVPMLEINPWQAVQNNVLACKVMMEHAVNYNADHFVLISTDKAVRPTNVMGASKRVCELMVNACMGNSTKVMSVRFGNVVGSAGSVVPLFRDQIRRGGPVTITHPEVTRFFMTIPEATQLILQTGTQGTGGEIFILDMGTPIKIADMARDLIRLSGKVPDEDVEIQYTGLRPGEKLYEELITDGEGITRTSHEKILVLESHDCWNGFYTREKYREWLFGLISGLEAAASEYDGRIIRKKMKEIVPEYEAWDGESVFSSREWNERELLSVDGVPVTSGQWKD